MGIWVLGIGDYGNIKLIQKDKVENFFESKTGFLIYL